MLCNQFIVRINIEHFKAAKNIGFVFIYLGALMGIHGIFGR